MTATRSFLISAVAWCRVRPLLVVALLAATLPASAQAAKLAVVPLRAGAGSTADMAGSLTDVVVAELRRLGKAEVITSTEIGAILGHEQEKMLLGCDDASCFAELGGALGAQELVAGSVSKLGSSWLLHLKRIDVSSVRVVAQSDRRLKGKDVDDLLDVLPAMVKELINAAPLAAGGAGAPAVSGTIGSEELPSPLQEVPLEDPKQREGLVLYVDGHGRYLALNPTLFNRSPLFFGDAKRLFKVRTGGGSKMGKTKYSMTAWEPRFPRGVHRQLNVVDGVATLTCGETKTQLESVPAKEAKALLAAATFFESRWTRGVTFVAMDTDGRYFMLDKAREPRNSKDYRLFVGPKGSVRYVDVFDVAFKGSEEKYLTKAGFLTIERFGYSMKGSWTPKGGKELELQVKDHHSEAKMAYFEIGAYGGETKLGTFCDPP